MGLALLVLGPERPKQDLGSHVWLAGILGPPSVALWVLDVSRLTLRFVGGLTTLTLKDVGGCRPLLRVVVVC